jgi:hypothetical protein
MPFAAGQHVNAGMSALYESAVRPSEQHSQRIANV